MPQPFGFGLHSIHPAGDVLPMRDRWRFLPKDFVETPEGLVFAVVAEGLEQGRVLGHLRYQRTDSGLAKLSVDIAQQLLTTEFKKYLMHSASRDVSLPAIPTEQIRTHYQPVPRLLAIRSPLVKRAAALFEALPNAVGITGSYLIGADGAESDIDLVIYGLENFEMARQIVASAIRSERAQELSDEHWETTFARRRETTLSFQDYLWHEKRKHNKFSLNDIKVDITCVSEPHPCACTSGQKIGFRQIEARISGDRHAFAWPAVFEIEHESIEAIMVYSATYTGQAKLGERVQAAGMLERTTDGKQRLVVGDSPNEFVRVVRG